MRLIDQLVRRYGQVDLVMHGKATITSYRSFLEHLMALSRINLTMYDLSQCRRDDVFCLRHDVDHSLEQALIMGFIEAEMGLVSSFYLLPPGDYDTTTNYYGQLVNGRIEHSDRLVEGCQILSHLGHEIGLHTDFVQLSVLAGRDMRDMLGGEIEFFRSLGISVRGTASHGSTFARRHGFTNYEIFSDREGKAETKNTRTVRIGEKAIELGTIAMSEVGLAYEAYHTPYDVYVSDVGSGFSLSSRSDRENTYTVQDHSAVSLEEMARRAALSQSAVVCLTHPEWWRAGR